MKNLAKERLKRQIEKLESMIAIYSDRDRVRMVELEFELHVANMELLDLMTNETKAA